MTKTWIPAAIIALGLVGAGYMVSNTAYKGYRASNVIAVKGLAEKEVKADLAMWTIRFASTSNDLQQAGARFKEDQKKVVDFLKSKGFDDKEIETFPVEVADLMAREYRSEQLNGDRYIVNGRVLLRSTQVDKVETASKQIDELINHNVSLAKSEYGASNVPSFKFTKLNEIKPEMLSQAAKNARQAAQQLASDTGASVGAMQSASQGYFSVDSRDDVEGNSGEGGAVSADTSVWKKVRVVTGITYYLN